MLKMLGVLAALVVITFAVGAGPAVAVNINFGALTPSNAAGCTHTDPTDTGVVCANGASFTANGSTFTATGFSLNNTVPTALTFKPLVGNPTFASPQNSLGESGIGSNLTGPGTACTDSFAHVDCEISLLETVAIVSDHPITDLIVGSIQGAENFRVFAGTSTATLLPISPTCVAGPVPETQTCTGFSALAIALGSGGIGDVVLVAVSQVPGPATLMLLGTALIGLRLARRKLA